MENRKTFNDYRAAKSSLEKELSKMIYNFVEEYDVELESLSAWTVKSADGHHRKLSHIDTTFKI
jgi:hypothetical protein